jgi:DNA-binding response OmpR family regulator
MKHKSDIIIIDDDPVVTELLMAYLSDMDLLVEAYNNPHDALEMVIHQKPSIVFLDLQMDGLRGDQIIVKLSEKYIFQTTTLFLLTGEPLSDMEHMTLMTLGFTHIINKPVHDWEIYNAIESVLGPVKLKNKAA